MELFLLDALANAGGGGAFSSTHCGTSAGVWATATQAAISARLSPAVIFLNAMVASVVRILVGTRIWLK